VSFTLILGLLYFSAAFRQNAARHAENSSLPLYEKNWSNSSEIIHPHRDGVDEIGPVDRLSSCTVVRVSYHDFADVQQSLDGRLFTDVDFLLSSQNTQQQTENCAHLLTEQQSSDYCTYKTKTTVSVLGQHARNVHCRPVGRN